MSRDFDASMLRAFVTCARAGSISAAAKLLGRSQPTLSEQLRRLEDVAGGALLARSSTGVSLTVRGETLLGYAESILSLSEEAQRALRREPLPGEVCGLNVLEDLWTPTLAARISDAIAGHEGARVELVSLPPPDLQSAVAAGRVDLVLGDPTGIDLPIQRSWRIAFRWIAAGRFEPSGRSIPVVLCSAPCRYRASILATLDRAGLAWHVAFESTTLNGVLAAVRSGIGVAAVVGGGEHDGVLAIATMPPLPSAEIALQRRLTGRSALVDAVGLELERSIDGLAGVSSI